MKFPDSDMHRVHFKSEWHRYNLKRKVTAIKLKGSLTGSLSLKVADLPIVSVAVFEAKKEAHEKAAKEGEKLPTVAFI